MSQVIAYSAPEGHARIVYPTGEIPFDEVLAKDVPPNSDAVVIDTSELPEDRMFRGAWVVAGITVVEDPAKAAEIAQSYRRARREELMAPLDKLVALNLPDGSAWSAEEARAEIRAADAILQQRIAAATSVAELRAIVKEFS